MANGINPLVYRLGFFRVWDSLFSDSLYIKNYNYFLKSQLINVYVDGFFKKWTWDGRRSYFLNFLYSHTELSWSYDYLNITIYVYNTGAELIFFKLLRELKNVEKFNLSLKKQYKTSKKKLLSSVVSKKNLSLLYSLLYEDSYKINSSDKNKDDDFFKALTQKNKKIIRFSQFKRGSYFERLRRHLRKFIYKSLKYSKGFFAKDSGIVRFGSLYLRKKHKNSNFLNVIILYIMLRKLLYYKLYKSFINLINFYFFINPLSQIFKRYFFKDFYSLLGLKKVVNPDKSVIINFVKLNSNSLTASAYSKHIWLKLYKKYSFGRVIQRIIRSVKSSNFIKGILVSCNGRFTKKQKAWHKVFRQGKIPFSTQRALVDSSVIFIKLRYGVSSVKININYV